MAATFGIFFGNSNFSLAMYKDGKTDVLANYAGDRVTPSMVSFVDGEKCVGTSAKQMSVRYASSTISHIKNLVGKESIDIKHHYGRTCKLVTKEGMNKFEIDDCNKIKYYSPEEILTFFFQHMLEIAQRCSQESTSFPAVLTVPWHFSDEQREITKECASEAGFEVLRVINEPTAAALTYKIGQESNHSNCNIVIFRVGGTSMDVTILEVLGGIYRILHQIHKENLGGNNMTKTLVDFCCQEFQRQYKVKELNKRALGKLWNAAEACKQGLTTVNTAQCCAESLHEGIDLSLNISRARFESLISPVLQQCLEQIDWALRDAGLKKERINKVVLVGGSTKISRLQDLIRDKFSNAEILCSVPPDEVIAIGAAEEAALLFGREENEVTEVDGISSTIYLKMTGNEGPVFVPVFKKGTTIPSKWNHIFNIPSGQTNFIVDVYEGLFYNNTEKAVPLATVVMNDIENSEISVSLQIRNDGSLHVICNDKISNKNESVIVEPSFGR